MPISRRSVADDHLVGRFEEALQIVHTLLREGTINFQGRYYEARECELRPRGPRPGGPPILVGALAHAPRMLRLTAQYADYWNTVNQLDRLARVREAVDAACLQVGRDPATLARTVSVLIDLPGSEGGPTPGWVRRFRAFYAPPVTGSSEELVALLQTLAREGVSHVQVWLEPSTVAGIDAFAPVLERLDRG